MDAKSGPADCRHKTDRRLAGERRLGHLVDTCHRRGGRHSVCVRLDQLGRKGCERQAFPRSVADLGSLARPLLNLEGAVYAPPDLPQQKFASAQRKQRAALTLSQGHVLIPFGTIAESASTARGWLITVDVTAWRIAASWCSTVTGSGGGIWHSGAGPAVAADGSIFVVTCNGAFQPDKGDYGESIVKLTLRTGAAAALAVDAWWTPWSDAQRSGSAGEMDDEG